MSLTFLSAVYLSLALALAQSLIGNPGAYTGNILWSKNVGEARIEGIAQYMNFSMYNNFEGGSINMWVTGTDLSSGGVVMLMPNGSYYYPNATREQGVVPISEDLVRIPLGPRGSVLTIPLPGYLGSARVWYANGTLDFYVVMDGEVPPRPGIVQPIAGVQSTDATFNINWGYMELSYGPDTTGSIAFVDISEVDFAGLPIGFALYGCEEGVQQVPGLVANAVNNMCANLLALPSNDSATSWQKLCIIDSAGDPIRVMSPGDIAKGTFDSFWSGYVDQVYEHYTNNILTIVGDIGQVLGECGVVENNLTCNGYSRAFSKPNAGDIFACNSGPFAITDADDNNVRATVPILCAAFNRGTFLLPGGDVQPQTPPGQYYSNEINNYYSKFVHANAYQGLGYAFPYDDVTPANETNESGTLVDTAPVLLAMTVGGPVLPWVPATSLTDYNCKTFAAPGVTTSTKFAYFTATAAPSCTAVPDSSAIVYSPATPQHVLNYTYIGCWTDSANQRTVLHELATSDMTLEYCAQTCLTNGYSVFGVEYYYQCFCDDEVNSYGTACPAAESDCNMACTGDPGQNCGGANRLNVYQISPGGTDVPTPSTPPTTTSIATSSPVDIATITSNSAPEISTSSSSVRHTSTTSTRSSSSSPSSTHVRSTSTTKISASTSNSESASTSASTSSSTSISISASTSSFSLITSSTITSSSLLTSSSTSTSSSAESSSATSSSSSISTTSDLSSTITPASSGTSTDTTTTPTAIVSPFGVGYIGCATDPLNGGGRALDGGGFNSSDMSVNDCVRFCQNANMPLAGLEDGTQCYCGSAITSSSGSEMLFANTTCDVGCASNANENCGGVQRLAIYYRNANGSAVL